MSAPVSSSSRAALSPSTSGSSSVPALEAPRPIRTSGVAKRARSVPMRRSQEAANSSAPPMQTPSIAAITGTGEWNTTRVRRWNSSIVAAKLAASAAAASNRSSPAEKFSPAPRTTRQRTAGSAVACSTASAIAAIVAPPHELR